MEHRTEDATRVLKVITFPELREPPQRTLKRTNRPLREQSILENVPLVYIPETYVSLCPLSEDVGQGSPGAAA